ncbi:MAG: hypothetical protein MK291_10015, partial [Planctomycetes bacterium]|nr:hypothetical protein [Planctomycetota bacterium]
RLRTPMMMSRYGIWMIALAAEPNDPSSWPPSRYFQMSQILAIVAAGASSALDGLSTLGS